MLSLAAPPLAKRLPLATHPAIAVVPCGLTTAVVTATSVYLLQTHPLAAISLHERSPDLVATYGHNLAAVCYPPDMLAVTTLQQCVLVYRLQRDLAHHNDDILLVFSSTRLLQAGVPLERPAGWLAFLADENEQPLLPVCPVLVKALRIGMGIDSVGVRGDELAIARHGVETTVQLVHPGDRGSRSVRVAADGVKAWIVYRDGWIGVDGSDRVFTVADSGEVHEVGVSVGEKPVLAYIEETETLAVGSGTGLGFYRLDGSKVGSSVLPDAVSSIQLHPEGQALLVHLVSGGWALTSVFGALFHHSPEPTTAVAFVDPLTVVATTSSGFTVHPLRRWHPTPAVRHTPLLYETASALVVETRHNTTTVPLPEFFLANRDYCVHLMADGATVVVASTVASTNRRLMCYHIPSAKWHTYSDEYVGGLGVVALNLFHHYLVVVARVHGDTAQHEVEVEDEVAIYNLAGLAPADPAAAPADFGTGLVVWRLVLSAPCLCLVVLDSTLAITTADNRLYRYHLTFTAAPRRLHFLAERVGVVPVEVVDLALGIQALQVLPCRRGETLVVVQKLGRLYWLQQTLGDLGDAESGSYTLQCLQQAAERLQGPADVAKGGHAVAAYTGQQWVVYLEPLPAQPLVVPSEDGYPLLYLHSQALVLYPETVITGLAIQHRVRALLVFDQAVAWYRKHAPTKVGEYLSSLNKEVVVRGLERVVAQHLDTTPDVETCRHTAQEMRELTTELQYLQAVVPAVRKTEVSLPGTSGKWTYPLVFDVWFGGVSPQAWIDSVVGACGSDCSLAVHALPVCLNYLHDMGSAGVDASVVRQVWNHVVAAGDYSSGAALARWVHAVSPSLAEELVEAVKA